MYLAMQYSVGRALRLAVELPHVECHCGAQVRQHTGHKRTFFYLEQLILKYNMDQQCTNVKDMHEVQSCPASSSTLAIAPNSMTPCILCLLHCIKPLPAHGCAVTWQLLH